MAEQLSEDQVSQLKDIFDSVFDKDGDGKISVGELGVAMRSLGRDRTEAQLQDMIKKYDKDGDGNIDFSEFLAMMVKKMKDMDDEKLYREALISGGFDTDDNGLISAAELREVMMNLGANLTGKDLDKMIEEADTEKDGQIKYEEFLTMMISRQTN